MSYHDANKEEILKACKLVSQLEDLTADWTSNNLYGLLLGLKERLTQQAFLQGDITGMELREALND